MTEYIAKCNEVVGISGKTLIVPDCIDASKEIVRCRDCRRFVGYCEWCDEEDPDGFCAWGARNDDSATKNDVSDDEVDANDADAASAEGSAGAVFVDGSQVFPPKALGYMEDSRERLEAEIDREFKENYKGTNAERSYTRKLIIGWLDRQAAITKRETLHDNPTCSGNSTCAASSMCTANRPISESADRETPKTAEIGASKDEIRDFDVWSVAYEIYCAGGYVDNGNEPNPPTDGIRELLDRQASITEREILSHPDERDEQIAELQQQVDELSERKCPGYDPARHYCKYHAQDFELNDRTVSRLKRENAALARDLAECERMREGLRARLSEAIGKASQIASLGDL